MKGMIKEFLIDFSFAAIMAAMFYAYYIIFWAVMS